MKKYNILIMGIVAASLLVGGCGKNDRTYYENNLQEAQEKKESCEMELKDAMLNFDKIKFKELSDDQECNIARDVVRVQKAKEREAQRAIELKKEEERIAKEKIAFDEDYKKHLSSFETMGYADFYAMKKECGFSFGLKKDAKCKAYDDLKKKKEEQAIEETIATIPKEEFIAYKESKCKSGRYDNMECDIAFKAYGLLLDRQNAYYTKHQDELKKDFNECQQKIQDVMKAQKYKEIELIKKTYKCDMAGQSAMKILQVSGWWNPIK